MALPVIPDFIRDSGKPDILLLKIMMARNSIHGDIIGVFLVFLPWLRLINIAAEVASTKSC